MGISPIFLSNRKLIEIFEAKIKAKLDRSPDFLRLANALSALYSKGSEEKRLLDAMLLATSR